MKIRCRYAMLLTFAAIMLGGCANNQWTRGDTYRHAALTGLMAADYLQTLQIARNPDDYHECNPILGEHPSPEKVTAYFLSSYAIITAASYALPADVRPWLQYAVIGVEAGAVANNLSIGLTFGF